MTLLAFEGIATATAMPVMARDLDALAGYTWAFNAYLVASLFGMVAGGLWSDATGPRGPIIAGVSAFCTGAVVAGSAPGLSVLVVGRGLQGVGGGVVIVSLYVLIARAFSVELRPKAFSVLAAAWVVPSLVGPVVAGWLADSVTWRAVFWLVPVFVIPPALLLFPRLHAYQGGTVQTDTRGRLAAGAMATIGLLAVQDGALRLSAVGAVEAVAGLAAVLVAVRHLLPAGTLLLRRGLPASVMLRGILSAAFFSAEVFIPLALIEMRGVSTTTAGLTLATATVLWSVGSYWQSRIPGQRDRSHAVRLGAALTTVCLVTLPLSLLAALPPWVAAVSWAVGALGMGLAIPSISVQVMRLSPEVEQGVNASAIQIADSVLVVVAIAVVGFVHATAVESGGASAATYTLLWLMSAALAVVAILTAGRMRPPASSGQ